MHDLKNILLAWVSSASAVFTAIEGRSFFTILSAVVLPTLFFLLGKAVDVGVQFYFRLREERSRSTEAEPPDSIGQATERHSLSANRAAEPQWRGFSAHSAGKAPRKKS